MDFFAAQDFARKQTKRLVLLFILAIITMILAVYLVLAFVFANVAMDGDLPSDPTLWLWNPILLALVTLGTLSIITIGSLWKFVELRSGGAAVAEMLGGRRLANNTANHEERVVLNIVEEMALASGIPVPPVYVLDQEDSINAFAAGYSPGDCVIGVNRGTVQKLTRDELQGVIAHEYSHILGGDMRLNLRLMAVLNGILVLSIVGYYCMRIGGMTGHRHGNRKNDGAIYFLVIGLAVWVIGSVGLLFSKMIKAAISRQREYLADASAVQFTRNPDGISGALKMLVQNGSKLKSEASESASHMFFGSSTASWLDTHPPLPERIQRIDPSFKGDIKPYLATRSRLSATGMAFDAGGSSSQAAASSANDDSSKDEKKKARSGFPFPGGGIGGGMAMGGEFPINPAVLLSAIGTPTTRDVAYAKELVEVLPKALMDAAHEGYGSRCVVFAMLLDAMDDAIRSKQIQIIHEREGENSAKESVRHYELLKEIDKRYRLPIIEIVQSSLVELSLPQYKLFRSTLLALVTADEKISSLEFILYHHLVTHLDRWFKQAPPPKTNIRNTMAIKSELVSLLGYLARVGNSSPQEQGTAFRAGWSSLGINESTQLDPRVSITLQDISKAIDRIGQATPQVKRQSLQACAMVIMHDRLITVEEAELFRAIGEAVDCPVPPLAAGELDSDGTQTRS